ncbi:MAG TPA: DinB family protein [Ignavibacteriaceae bacterium]|nr:DinB family protein [Ignavibacteriaceae bacterium]
MKNFFKVSLFLSFLLTPAYSVFCQQPAPTSKFTEDLLAEMEYVQNQILQLADAMPQEKYSWRPSDEVRSVSEVYMHIGGGDYFLLSKIGAPMPENFKPDMEKTVTQKSEIIAFLKKSFEDAKNFISNIKEEDLDKPVDFYGNKTNERRMLMVVLSHNHEHLGQSIAYARMNGIVPPWSKKQ